MHEGEEGVELLVLCASTQRGSLEAFIFSDFGKEMLEVPDYHNFVTIQVFRKGLVHEYPFYDSLTIRTSNNMVDILQCTAEFIKLVLKVKFVAGPV